MGGAYRCPRLYIMRRGLSNKQNAHICIHSCYGVSNKTSHCTEKDLRMLRMVLDLSVKLALLPIAGHFESGCFAPTYLVLCHFRSLSRTSKAPNLHLPTYRKHIGIEDWSLSRPGIQLAEG